MQENWAGTMSDDTSSVAAPTLSSSVATTTSRRAQSGGLSEQISSLPAPVRTSMEQIARNATSADEALGPIIELLVDGSPAKRAAIVTAFRTNIPLREQWERTYEILRG